MLAVSGGCSAPPPCPPAVAPRPYPAAARLPAAVQSRLSLRPLTVTVAAGVTLRFLREQSMARVRVGSSARILWSLTLRRATGGLGGLRMYCTGPQRFRRTECHQLLCWLLWCRFVCKGGTSGPASDPLLEVLTHFGATLLSLLPLSPPQHGQAGAALSSDDTLLLLQSQWQSFRHSDTIVTSG